MVVNQVLDAYRQTAKQAAIPPVKLIHMMYERVLTHLEYAETAIKEGSPRKRGENLGRAIALITELNASVKPDDDSEAAKFLRGLYAAILAELPKVSVSNDPAALRQAARYIRELKNIWEETAMQEEMLAGKGGGVSPGATAESKIETPSETGRAVVGLSVSI